MNCYFSFEGKRGCWKGQKSFLCKVNCRILRSDTKANHWNVERFTSTDIYMALFSCIRAQSLKASYSNLSHRTNEEGINGDATWRTWSWSSWRRMIMKDIVMRKLENPDVHVWCSPQPLYWFCLCDIGQATRDGNRSVQGHWEPKLLCYSQRVEKCISTSASSHCIHRTAACNKSREGNGPKRFH